MNVSAITSNEVTYENEGISETLTNTINTLYGELKEYRTSGTVTSNEMLEGYIGYSKGKLISGSIPSKGNTTYTPGVNNQVITKGQYLSENQVILGDVNLVSENIKEGIEIFGIKGSIKDNSGKTLEATNVTTDNTYTYLNIPESGYYDTNSRISVNNINSNMEGKFYYLGTGTNFNLTMLFPNQYKNFTSDNFVINYKGIGGTKSNMGRNDKADVANYSVIEATNPSKNYNQDTGIFTINNMLVRGGWENEKYGYKPVQVSIAYDVYLIIN